MTGLEMSSRVFTATNTQRKLVVAVCSVLSVCSLEEIQRSRDHRWTIRAALLHTNWRRRYDFLTAATTKQKSVPPPTETQCLSCCLQSPANCNTTSLLLALLGHACH